MIVLLPPSETKATRSRGKALALDALTWPELTPARAQVLDALAVASARPDAAHRLGVSPNLTEQIARNMALFEAPTLPAAQLYTGVLYDALDLTSLAGADKTRASRRVVISSGAFGAIRLGDRLAPYRLSMSVNLPGVGPLASFWQSRLDAPLTEAAGNGLIIDCRSSTYAASWSPSGELTARWVHIRVPGATHMAKHTRGLATRALVTDRRDPRTPQALAAMLSETFDTDLHAPRAATKPWVLDVAVRSGA